ncbi:unnamed protein product [Pleuronectes platessa]|uniref:Uncharacterized protein n=1 Tax=Pleuronectes platessa TaxID=8262 RepID=A0A9N7YS48_PLEPL|nr:unnamed protein product [Pleuronectes platessa]
MKTLISERSANFLLNASLLFKETCPELSRFYLQGYEKANTKASVQKKSICPLQSTTVCSHCYQWLQPDNHRVRLRPKQRPPARVWSILRRHAKGKRLSLAQKHLLRRFKKSSSVLHQWERFWPAPTNPTDKPIEMRKLTMEIVAMELVVLW